MTAFYKQSWFAPVASAATTFLFPSLGNAVGGAANSLLGGALSEGVANAVGSAGVGALIGGVSNGGQGALTGALAGAGTSALMGATGYTGGLTGLLNNGTFAGQPAASAVTGGLRDSNIATTNGVTGGNAAAGEASNAAGGALGMLGNGKGGISPAVIAGLALAGTMGGSLMGGNKQAQNPQQGAAPTDPNMTRGLSQVAFNRSYRAPEGDLKTYGMRGPQHRFFDNNQLPVAAAEGGYIAHPMRSERAQYEQAHARLRQAEDARRAPVRETPAMRAIRHMRSQQAVEQGEMTGYARGGVSGPGHGREDAIPAVLSDGEYVIDATTVALLGDGSTKAGVQKLDQMRDQIRRRAGGALAKGEMGPNAKPALAYVGGK